MKITDFGLAKLAEGSDITADGTRRGTIAYMSPEQARGEAVDHRTDIWSLGVVLYEMLAGERPFTGDHEESILYKLLNEAPLPIRDLRSDIPLELGRIVDRALSKNSTDRYQRRVIC